METMHVVLPDGSTKEVPEHATVADVASAVSPELARAVIAGKIDGDLVDATTVVKDGAHVEVITETSPEALEIMRHSAAHIMAEAVARLWPDAQIAFGPATDDGFFHDFALEHVISGDDFPAINAEMVKIIEEDKPFVREVISRSDAEALFSDQRFKLECIAELPPEEPIVIYRHGSFVTLCRGPHVFSPRVIKACEVMSVAGAYWKGDAANEMLQRLYGAAFFSKKELDEHRIMIEEARKNDHRILGPKMGIFETFDEVGPGLPLFPPNGGRVVRTMQEWLRRALYKTGYEEVITPHLYKAGVWKTSGHYDFYHDNMYFLNINEGSKESPRLQEFGVKPMNCPGHVLLYKAQLHSYREMPIRFFEFGTVYRHELSGTVHGLFRARGFTQDDAHVFCREDQVVDEVDAIVDLVDYIMTTFDLTYSAEISTRPEHSIGTDYMWDKAEGFLREALERRGLPYEINEGDGAFYGPKIDIKVKDSLNRTWQCSTIQVDFNFPERFELTYRTADNTLERPWMLHRAIFGSIERFLGILIEHYAGAFPLWLAPIQAVVIPVADRHLDYARKVAEHLRAVDGRVEIAEQSEPMRVKIAKAQERKIPYMLVVGDKEEEEGVVSVRERSEGDLGVLSLDDFTARIADARVSAVSL